MAGNQTALPKNIPTMQLNNLNVPIQPQLAQPRQTPQYQPDPEKRRPKSSPNSIRRKVAEMETTKNKADFDGNKQQLKILMEKYGNKAKTIDDLDMETIKLRNNIESLRKSVQRKGKQLQVSPPPPLPVVELRKSREISLARSLFTLFLLPFQLLLQLLRVIYQSMNWNVLLIGLLFVELSIIGLIWGVRRSYYNYLYLDPYEAVVHGTFGMESSSTWSTVVWASVTIMRDFLGEVMSGGRGFGSPGYSGFVPV